MVREYWKQVWKIRKMAAASWRNLFWLSFQDVFWKLSLRCLPLTGLGQIKGKQTKKQKKLFSYSLVLKADERCHDFRWYRLQFLQTLVLIFPWKSTQVKIHAKMTSFCLVFSAKNPVKSDKLALIEGKILNEMFLDIYIPVVPIENWLGVTHNQSQKILKVASVLLFCHIFKTKLWPACI